MIKLKTGQFSLRIGGKLQHEFDLIDLNKEK